MYEINDIDTLPSYGATLQFGYKIDSSNDAFLNIGILWIHLQLKISFNGSALFWRTKFGNNDWYNWKQI